ncbi:MAG: bacillithiol biosynthesis cysteine-adding enzyme BshC [Firmicutes bacterium]|nr:bacillithiol biosynthesis cysteine-adding enzyme BshC [Bacillota bacterium]
MIINFDKIPKTSRLFSDYLYNYDKVSDFYNYAPYEMVEFTMQFEKLRERQYNRDAIADILIEQNKKYGAGEQTLKSIEKIRNPKTFVIFTGQQVGIFGGPLYTIYKALTAANLALHLSVHTPYTVLPFFWIEGEDHDFDEIRTVSIIDKNNELLELSWEPEEPFKGQVVGEMIIDTNMTALIDKLADAVFDTEFKEGIISTLRECYQPGRNLADAFGCWMAKMMDSHGLIMVDPSDPRFKKMALPVYKTCLEKHRTEINKSLSTANEKLIAAGYHAQVGHRADTLDFFYHAPARLPIIHDDGCYAVKGTDLRFTPEELEKFLEENICDFSPNVMLRPQVQDYLFPTAAYVAGPGEIAYYAQFKGIYDVFDIPMPVIYPRKSITIMEKRTEKLLNSYGLEFTDVIGGRAELERKIIKKSCPDGLRDALEKTRTSTFSHLETLEKEAAAFNPNLQPIIKKLAGRIDRELAATETRIANEMEEKGKTAKSQAAKILMNLYPDNKLQERKLNILTYLYKYDFKLIDAIRCISCVDQSGFHRIWNLDMTQTVCRSCHEAMECAKNAEKGCLAEATV